MSYTADEILELAPAIERLGGALLTERCEGRFASYQVPGSEKTTNIKTCYCKQQTLYVMPYEPTDAKDKTSAEEFRARGAGFTRVCLNCDLIGHWPNFENVLGGAND